MTSAMNSGRPRGLARRRSVIVASTSAVFLAAIAIDVATKGVALRELDGDRTIALVPTVELRLVFNPGVAFGAGASVGPLLRGLLLVLLAALLVWVAYRVVVGAGLAGTLALAAAAGGGAGNLLDRFGTGTGFLADPVTDFIAVDWFAVFNIADIFTTCGIALWVLTYVFQTHQTRAEGAATR